MFMTHLRLPQTHYSHVHLHNTAVSASLALLLSLSTACSGNETTTTDPANKPRPRVEEDAGMRCEAFDDDYRDAFKGCAVDDDCETRDVEFTCRGAHGAFGVAKSDREEFDRCLPDATKLRGCANGLVPATRAEDGRVAASDLKDVHARCIEGSCQTRIEDRSCGSSERVCAGTQLCISFQDAMGVTQFQCTDNKCVGAKLDCECVGKVCDLAADKPRVCAVDLIQESDVFCKVELR
jgi:hypothetical protein